MRAGWASPDDAHRHFICNLAIAVSQVTGQHPQCLHRVVKSCVASRSTSKVVHKGVHIMPNKTTIKRAKQDKKAGKSPSTQAGEFIRETMDDIRAGRIGARSTKQAIAIGLSKARRAGVDLPPPAKGKTSEKTRKSAARAYQIGQTEPERPVNPKRSKATKKALQREGDQAASHEAISRQTRKQAKARTPEERSASARKGAQTRLAHQTSAKRSAIAKKGARTRRANAKT